MVVRDIDPLTVFEVVDHDERNHLMDAVLHRDEVLRLLVEVDGVEVLELGPGGSRSHVKSGTIGARRLAEWLIVGANVIEVNAHIVNLILSNSDIPFEMIQMENQSKLQHLPIYLLCEVR